MAPQIAFNSSECSLLVRSYYDVQKLRIEHGNRIKALVRQGEMSEEMAEWHHGVGMEGLKSSEASFKLRIDQSTRDHPMRAGFLDRVRGIGPVIAGGLIANISRRRQRLAVLEGGAQKWVTAPELFPNEAVCEERYESIGVKELLEDSREAIACFETISSLWQYCGVGFLDDGTVQRRRKNTQSNWSSSMKVLAWKIGESFVKAGGAYRDEYDAYREKQRLLHPKAEKIEVDDGKGGKRKKTQYNDGHIHNRAMRYAAKLLIAHTWMFWRESEGLTTRSPWIIEHGGHGTLKHWSEYLDPKKSEKVERRLKKRAG